MPSADLACQTVAGNTMTSRAVFTVQFVSEPLDHADIAGQLRELVGDESVFVHQRQLTLRTNECAVSGHTPLSNPNHIAALALFESGAILNPSMLEAELGVSYQTVRRILQLFEQLKLIERQGRGRYRRYGAAIITPIQEADFQRRKATLRPRRREGKLRERQRRILPFLCDPMSLDVLADLAQWDAPDLQLFLERQQEQGLVHIDYSGGLKTRYRLTHLGSELVTEFVE